MLSRFMVSSLNFKWKQIWYVVLKAVDRLQLNLYNIANNFKLNR